MRGLVGATYKQLHLMRDVWAKETCGWFLGAEMGLSFSTKSCENIKPQQREAVGWCGYSTESVGMAISSCLYCTSKWRGVFDRWPWAPSSHCSPEVQEGNQGKGHQTFIIGKRKLFTIKPTDQNSPKGWLNAVCLETMVLGIQRGFRWIMIHMQKCSTFLTGLCWKANVPMLLKYFFAMGLVGSSFGFETRKVWIH